MYLQHHSSCQNTQIGAFLMCHRKNNEPTLHSTCCHHWRRKDGCWDIFQKLKLTYSTWYIWPQTHYSNAFHTWAYWRLVPWRNCCTIWDNGCGNDGNEEPAQFQQNHHGGSGWFGRLRLFGLSSCVDMSFFLVYVDTEKHFSNNYGLAYHLYFF